MFNETGFKHRNSIRAYGYSLRGMPRVVVRGCSTANRIVDIVMSGPTVATVEFHQKTVATILLDTP